MIAAAILAVLGATLASDTASDDLDRALAAVRGAAFRAHLAFLADDLLEGRDTGSRGYDLAARYVASELEAMGLQPAGERGGWLQPVPLRQSRILESDVSFAPAAGGAVVKLTAPEDYVQFGVPSAPSRGSWRPWSSRASGSAPPNWATTITQGSMSAARS